MYHVCVIWRHDACKTEQNEPYLRLIWYVAKILKIKRNPPFERVLSFMESSVQACSYKELQGAHGFFCEALNLGLPIVIQQIELFPASLLHHIGISQHVYAMQLAG